MGSGIQGQYRRHERRRRALSVIDALTAAGAKVRAYDPLPSNARSIIKDNKNVEFTDSAEAALNGADVLAVITEWLEFRSPNFEDLARKLKAKAIFDGRNLYDPATVRPRVFNTLASGADRDQAGQHTSHRGRRLHWFVCGATAIGARRAVVGLDDLNDYYDPELKRARLARLERFRANRSSYLS